MHVTESLSLIIPCHNARNYLTECLESVLAQDLGCTDVPTVELSVFDDSSTDGSDELAKAYRKKFENAGFMFTFGEHKSESPGGVAFAKNSAVKQSSGNFLCFLDADDVCSKDRILLQYRTAVGLDDMTLIGSNFTREPIDSTVRYTKWANSLTSDQLYTQIYTSNGPTLIAPTWFCSRKLYSAVGGFEVLGARGFPEDLDFFYKALRLGAKLYKIDQPLVIYRFHTNCASLGVSEESIFRMRISEFEKNILSTALWSKFSVWNAGKAGKKFFAALSTENRRKVAAFCDVDKKKIARRFYEPYDINKSLNVGDKFKIPIISHEHVQPPVAICVKMDLTDGDFETNLAQKCWVEGKDFYYVC